VPFTAGREGAWESDEFTPVFVISVAAELSGLHAQTLRQYDRLGLVSPGRTSGGGRRYSRHDIAMLREVVRLTSLGLGLEGVKLVLDLEHHVQALQMRVRELQADLEEARAAAAAQPPTALVVWRPQHPQRAQRTDRTDRA
jgi:MerR family transcriptional regulator, heat shock protein HspR